MEDLAAQQKAESAERVTLIQRIAVLELEKEDKGKAVREAVDAAIASLDSKLEGLVAANMTSTSGEQLVRAALKKVMVLPHDAYVPVLPVSYALDTSVAQWISPCTSAGHRGPAFSRASTTVSADDLPTQVGRPGAPDRLWRSTVMRRA